MENKINLPKALLIYSKDHFDPSSNKELSSSAGIIAKSLYSTLLSAGFSVDYLDYPEIADITEEYDIFIGHLSNWSTAAKKSKARTKILFMPTTHPLSRNTTIKKYSKKWKEPVDELLEINTETLTAFKEADFILQIGNEYAIKALLKNGVPLKKIVHIHYGITHLDNGPVHERNLDNFLHLAGGVGLRKGLPKVIEVFSKDSFSNKKIDIVGSVFGGHYKTYWEEKIKSFLKKNQRARYLGFIKSDTEEYKKLLDANSWLIFPSIEEGEPGTVLEAMSRGVVPIAEMEGCGINFTISAPENTSIDTQMDLAQKIKPREWGILSKKAQRYVTLFHDHTVWEDKLKDLFMAIKNNKKNTIKYPHTSIVLSVFNKEKSIQELLRDLWKHTKTYPNWDLHIIFDGCTDKTKALAEKTLSFFTIPVFIYETPNIFEVKSNNLGLKNARGDYCVILQDDNFLSEKYWLEKMIDFMQERPKVAVLGGLAGVNFYKLDSDEIGLNKTYFEVHKRIDWLEDKEKFNFAHEVDAVMRGPIILRKGLLDKYGYLDEIYAPFYDDDMDYCFRMRKLGFGVFYFPIMVENRNLTIANYSEERKVFWEKTMCKNSNILYSRWEDFMENHETQLILPKPDWYKENKFLTKIKCTLILVRNKIYLYFSIKKMIKTTIKNIVMKIPGTLVMFLVKNLYKISNKITSVAKKIFLYRFQKRTVSWHAINGDGTLRIKYDLNNDSTVFDIGGYNGQWAHEISALYGSKIHIFEPIKKFYEIIAEKYKNNDHIIIKNYGLSNKEAQLQMSLDENSSSQFKTGEESEYVNMIRAIDYIKENNINTIDLMKINIEGGEYDLLEHLINEGFIKNIMNIQVQFHDFIPNAEERMKNIQTELKKTHHVTYQFEFVWENWERNLN